MRVRLVSLILCFLSLASCSKHHNYFLSSYSSASSLAIIEGIEWDNGSSNANVNILIANLFYGTGFDGEIKKLVYSDYESIEVSTGIFKDDAYFEFSNYPVDMVSYNSKECGILLENAKNAKPSDFKLSYTFNLRELLLSDNVTEMTIDNLCFLIKYTEKNEEDVYNYSRMFAASAMISNNSFSLSNVEFNYI